MKKQLYIFLSRRESQILDIIYRLKEASVADVLEHMDDPPGYNSIRVILTILEKKGYLTHRREKQKYIYVPTELPENAKRSALTHMVSTFFEGSTQKIVSTLLDISAGEMSEEELSELASMIQKARKEKKR